MVHQHARRKRKSHGKCKVLAATGDPHPFRWDEIEREPKVMRCCLTRLHRTMEYEILHTGGFLRLCTERGRVYWIAQNTEEHRTPDWKIHFSVHPSDVPQAWDIISRLFIGHGCDFGMKVVSGDFLPQWPHKQRGREVTIYIFQHHAAYAGGGPMIGHCRDGTEHRYWLGPEFERDSAFWEGFVRDAEYLLQLAGIRCNGGTATGDLPLGGPYASIRNEAFVWLPDEHAERPGTMSYIYPPNDAGWNAAGHPCPIRVPRLARWRAGTARAMSAVSCPKRC